MIESVSLIVCQPVQTTDPWLIQHFEFVIPLAGVALGLLLLSNLLFCKLLGFQPGRVVLDQQNVAMGIVHGAFLIGLATGLEALFFGRHSEAYFEAMVRLATEGVVVIPLLLASIHINDRLILPGINIFKAIRDERCIGIALTVAGSCIASGLVIDGALTGYSDTMLEAVGDILLFWFLAQLLMVLAARIYQRTRPYDFRAVLVEKDNIAAGISMAALLISIGFIARAAVIHAGRVSWWAEALISACFAITGTVLLLLCRKVLLRFLVGKRDFLDELEFDRNYAGTIVVAAAQIAIALIISAASQRPVF